jgi:hypothetical protein
MSKQRIVAIVLVAVVVIAGVVIFAAGGDSGDGRKASIGADTTGLSISNARETEGDSGTKAVSFTITRSGTINGNSSVTWETADGTATSGDYSGTYSTLYFGSNQTTKTVVVNVKGDTVDEDDETFKVVLSEPTNAAILEGKGTGTATIVDDDGGAYVASTGTDTGACSTAATACRTVTYALTKVNAGATIKVSGTIPDHVEITKSVTISGADAPAGSPAVIDGTNSPNQSVVDVSGGAVTLDHLRIEHGNGTTGGGISNARPLTLNHVTVADNVSSGVGAGIYSPNGTLTINNSTVTRNNSGDQGAGIYGSNTPVTITDSTISDNTASSKGGGIFLTEEGNQPLTLLRTTISGNKSSSNGGGIFAYNAKVISSTIAGNTASFGGAIWAVGPVSVYGSTIVGNSRTGIDVQYGHGSVTLADSIIAQNLLGSTTSNCKATDPQGSTLPPFISSGYNLTDDSGADCALTKPTDVKNISPALGTLAANGGPTQTILPTTSSPARNRVPTGTTTFDGTALCPGNDQRGIARPKSGATKCTIGAVEP